MRIAARDPLLLTLVPLALLLGGCRDEELKPAEQIRPVRTVLADPRPIEDRGTLTGEIQPRYQSDIGFRIDGKVIKRFVDIGASVKPGDLLARLDDAEEQNRLTSAKSEVAAARAELVDAATDEGRQRTLLTDGFTTQARYDNAERRLKTAQARLESTQAALRTSQDKVAYSTLRADDAGVVTAIGAEPGQVVPAGKMVVRIARSQEKEAVFNVSEAILRHAPSDPLIEVSLLDDPALVTTGRIREVAPSADPATRTFSVRISLQDPPAAMMMGSPVLGRVRLAAAEAVALPASALFKNDGAPVVWVVDQTQLTVSPKPVTVLRYDADRVILSAGLDRGERVVAAGVQKMRPGLRVRLLDETRSAGQ